MNAAAELLRLTNGFRISQAIHVAATLGISDHLAAGPRTAAELAAVTACDPESLYRLLRALASVGVYEESADGRFTSTAIGDEMRRSNDRAVGDWARFIGRPYFWQAWGALEHSVRTGENAFASIHGVTPWEFREKDPAEGAIFDAAMTAMSRYVADAVVDAYNFGSYETVADIGGGRGAMLAVILQRYPGVRGVLFDQPHVVTGAPELLAGAGVADRCEIVGGDMFATVPGNADAYVLKALLHDWRDEQAMEILRVCRRDMKPGAVLLILERVLTPAPYVPGTASAAFSDLNMLVGPGGQERTRTQYADLLASVGLRLTNVVATTTDVSVIEARA